MDGASGFTASTRSEHPLALDSNCSWGLFVGGLKNAVVGHIFTDISSAREVMLKRTASCDSMASNKLKYATERKCSDACRHCVDELKVGHILS